MSKEFLDNIRNLAAKLLSSLWILKCEGIVHGDIKPENIFFSIKDSSPSPLTSHQHHHARPFSSSSSYTSSSQKTPRHENTFLDFGAEAREIDFILGDFGNSFLLSESMKFYRDFELQSLPYRSPEILCGLPFNHQIDLWSVGIVLLEMCLGQTLFVCETREELFLSHCELLTPPQVTRFAGGRYSRELFSLIVKDPQGAPITSSSTGLSFSDHYRNIYHLLIAPHRNSFARPTQSHHSSSLLSPPLTLQSIYPTELIHLIASLLYPDPDIRLNIQDALQHSFISSFIRIPMSLWSNTSGGSNNHHRGLKARSNKHSTRIETLRTSSQVSKAEMKDEW
jgi:serine/threonine protein kinase